MTSEEGEIQWGKKMIKVSIHFWTDGLPKGVDKKTAWATGAIHMMANKQRGIKHNHVFFNRKEDLLSKLQELLDKNNVKLIKLSKYEVVDLKKVKHTN